MADKPIGKIYQTTNYDKFLFRDDNRPVDQQNVVKLIKSIEAMGLRIPIKVDKDFYVLDGQHRLNACMHLKIPVYYYVDEETMSTSEIASLQSTTKKWNYSDFAHSFASNEQPGGDYKLYNNFTSTYSEFPHSTAILMLCNSRGGGGGQDRAFRTGRFKVKSFAKAKQIAEYLRELSPYYKGYNKKGFVASIVVMMNHTDFDAARMLRKMPKRCKEIHDFSKTEHYLDTLQDIYNWKETKKVYFH